MVYKATTPSLCFCLCFCLLVQCANAAIKNKKNPNFRIKYDRIKKRRGHKRAIIAIARMILTCIYHMFLNGEVFNPSDMKFYVFSFNLFSPLNILTSYSYPEKQILQMTAGMS